MSEAADPVASRIVVERLDVRDRPTAEQLLAVQHAAYRVEADLIGFDGIPPLHEGLDELIADPVEWSGIREGGRVIAGVAIARAGRRCSIDKLVVHPSHHRRGLGRRLVEHVLRLVDQEPINVFEVSTGTGNVPARRLYESLGFRVLYEREIGPGVTATHYEWWRRSIGTSFDADVANYEAARPGYPDELYDRLTQLGALRNGGRVLELGAGPGPVTAALVARGASVVAVEPGAQMAARLRDRFARDAVTVVESTFEDASVAGPFDLAVAGTSLHWIDPHVVYVKLASLLPPGAVLAPWWNVHGPVDFESDPNEEELRRVLDPFIPIDRARPVYARDVEARRKAIERDGLFELTEHRRFSWPWRHDPASLRALFASFSDVVTLPDPDRSTLLDRLAEMVEDRFGGVLTRTYTTELYVARRLAAGVPG